ncbi:hypothetical protein K438DRAFT_1972631 [Mycena galopus ATCC 62051]|nr:hypothetical protein K438DRAFT_1972631 [Mycena galopus ATCC 62051]
MPQSEIVQDLVKKSSGYFIYASNVKFIGDKRFRPVDRLNIVLGIKSRISGSPFDTLDWLYHQILSAVPLNFRPKHIELLAVISANLPLTVSETELLLDLKSGDHRLILRDLVSVVHLREGFSQCVLIYHASFLDFLHDPARSGVFYISSSQCRSSVTCHILKALSYEYGDLSGIHRSWDSMTGPAIDYITSMEPSPNLAPLVQSINPHFIFVPDAGSMSIMHMLHWLKKFDPRQEGLIHLWEDYAFMALCDEAWGATEWKESSNRRIATIFWRSSLRS